MKTLFVILSILFLSVSLFANDSCFVNATLTGIATGSGVNGSVTATLSGNVTNKNGNTISANVTGQVSGSIVGSISGTITATITNSAAGSISGNFVGIATGIASGGEGNPSQSVTCNTNGNANGNIICIPVIESESDCRTGLECDPNNLYGIRVCNFTTGKYDTICVKDMDDISSDMKPILVSEMPICFELDAATIPNPHSYYHTVIIDVAGINEDIENAVNQWNCLCGYSGCNKKIKISFSEDKALFNWEERNTLALTNTNIDGSDCSVNLEKTWTKFNNTSFFRYQDKLETHISEPSRSFINARYEYLLADVSDFEDNNFFSFLDIATHEFGHILGFVHPDEKCEKEMADATGTDIKIESILNTYVKPNIPSQGLSDYDKCMFITFYCPVSIYEYESQTQKVYPNPGYHVISIDFTLPDYCENVRIYIQNPLGQVVLVPIENIAFEGGDHTELINVDSLPVGVYYIIIEAGAYLSAQPINVIR